MVSAERRGGGALPPLQREAHVNAPVIDPRQSAAHAAARQAWGAPLPDWIDALACFVARCGRAQAAQALGYSPAAISRVLHCTYPDPARIEAKVRQLLLTAAGDWIDALRQACAAESQHALAERLGYSDAVVSAVLRGKYRGDLARVEQQVRDVVLRPTVSCPLLGTITGAECVANQRIEHPTSNPLKQAIWRACRSGCPNSRLEARFK